MHSSHTNHSTFYPLIIFPSIHPPLTLHFVSTLSKTPLHSAPHSLTHSLAHFTLRSICFLLPLPLPATLRCRPTYGMNQRGAVTKSTQLQTRDEDHATLCDPLAVAAGDAVCASLAFSITAPPPHTTHKTHSALQLNGARPPEPKRKELSHSVSYVKEKKSKKEKEFTPPTNEQTLPFCSFRGSCSQPSPPIPSAGWPDPASSSCFLCNLRRHHLVVDLAEWHYVLKGAASDETYGRATDAARSALFYFIYILLFILILLLKVIIVCRPPAPSPTQLTTLPSPHTHVNTNVTCRVSL